MSPKAAKTQKGALPIYVLNGPNLNLLGARETDIYGHATLADIGRAATARARAHGYPAVLRQSNHEGDLIDWVQEARTKSSGLIINAGALSHSSIALLDACRALGRPLIEVHLSNPFRREVYRRHSYISEAASGLVCGIGAAGYVLAVDALAELLKGRAT